MRLYYYADEAENRVINSCQHIKAKDTNDGLGKSVRFSELPPDRPKDELISNNWRTGNAPTDAEQKIEFWFRFESTKLPPGTKKSTNVGSRKIWTCPTDVPLTDAVSSTTLLYHYTDRKGRVGIHADQVILATDAADELGTVVRFTELPHDAPKATLIDNNFWGRSDVTQEDRNKLRNWFKFELRDLPAGTERVDAGERNIWTCPVDVPLIKPRRFQKPPARSADGKIVLYHYTDRKGKDAIHACGYIKAMRPHGGEGLGATMPVAVYFTELTPDSEKEDLLWNMYGTKDTSKTEMVEKTRYWFKFESTDLPGVKRRENRKQRNEWVCESDVPVRYSKRSGVIRSRNANNTDQNAPGIPTGVTNVDGFCTIQ